MTEYKDAKTNNIKRDNKNTTAAAMAKVNAKPVPKSAQRFQNKIENIPLPYIIGQNPGYGITRRQRNKRNTKIVQENIAKFKTSQAVAFGINRRPQQNKNTQHQEFLENEKNQIKTVGQGVLER